MVLEGEDPEIWMSTRRASTWVGCVIHFHLVEFYPGDRVRRQLYMIQTIPDRPLVFESRGTRSVEIPDMAVQNWIHRLDQRLPGLMITADTPGE